MSWPLGGENLHGKTKKFEKNGTGNRKNGSKIGKTKNNFQPFRIFFAIKCNVCAHNGHKNGLISVKRLI